MNNEYFIIGVSLMKGNELVYKRDILFKGTVYGSEIVQSAIKSISIIEDKYKLYVSKRQAYKSDYHGITPYACTPSIKSSIESDIATTIRNTRDISLNDWIGDQKSSNTSTEIHFESNNGDSETFAEHYGCKPDHTPDEILDDIESLEDTKSDREELEELRKENNKLKNLIIKLLSEKYL